MLYLSPVKNGHRKYWRVRKRPETVCLAYCWARVLVTIANIELFKPDSKCRLYTMLMCNVRYMAVVCEWVRVVYGNGICLNFNFGLKQLHGIFECCSGCVSVGLLYGLYRHLNGENGAKRINVRHTHTQSRISSSLWVRSRVRIEAKYLQNDIQFSLCVERFLSLFFASFHTVSIVSRSVGQWFILQQYSLRFSSFRSLLFVSTWFLQIRTPVNSGTDRPNPYENARNIRQRLYKIIIICIIPNKVDKTVS